MFLTPLSRGKMHLVLKLIIWYQTHQEAGTGNVKHVKHKQLHKAIKLWYNIYTMVKKRQYGSKLEQMCAEYETYGQYKVHVPSHHVYYVRAALEERTGKTFSVEDVEKALVAEDMLPYDGV